MRFAEVDLLRYGHFEDCRLQFPQNPTDLQIVFGDNEAGKSTTMAAINDLLFGFPHVTPYAFRFDNQLLRIGAILEADGNSLACRRKKGRAGTLLDLEDRVQDEAALVAMLAGYSGEGFQRMFSLDHMRLREGGRAILAAQDDIGQAIFAAGAGLVSVATVLEGLETESREIWTKRAGDRRYYAAQHAYYEARTRQKAAQIKPGAWDDLRQELARLDAALENFRSRRGTLEREREEVERRRRVLPHAALYRRAQAELAPLVGVPDLPPDGVEVLNQVATALATSDTEDALAQAERERTQISLDTLRIDLALIERRDEIEALRETKGAVDKSVSDLPRRRAELAMRDRRLTELQRELGWPHEAAPEVKGRLAQRVLLAELRGLLEMRSALDATLSSAETDEVAAHETLERLQIRLDELPAVRDFGELSAALKAARDLGDLEAAIRVAEREKHRRSTALEANVAQLAPWTGGTETLRNLLLPSDGETAAALAERAQAELGLAEARREHQIEFDRKAALELQRTQLVRDDSAISPEAIQEAREDRDTLWRDVRAHLVDGTPLPDAPSAAEDFERRTSIADGIADQRYGAAEQSARLTALQEDLERNALALAQQERRLTEAQAHATVVAGQWQRSTAPLGFQIEPRAFGPWLDRRRRALESADEVALADSALQEIKRQRDGASARLAAALTAAGDQAAVLQPFGLLVQAAERFEGAETGIVQDRRDLNMEIAVAGEASKKAGAKQLAARRGLVEWESRWIAVVTAAGLSQERPHAVVRAQLDLLEEMRGEVEEILSLQQRVIAIEADVTAFAEQVEALAGACGLQSDGRAPDRLLFEIAAAAREAAAGQVRRAALADQLVGAERRISDAATARAHALARLRPLAETAGTEDRGELTEAVQRADRARHLRKELDRLAEEILKAGAGPSLEFLLSESEGVEAATMAVRSNELQEALTNLSDEIARLTGERATAQAAFARLDDGPDAAIAAADAEQARAEMAAQAEAYVRKRAEAALLRWAISRYRAQKQTPLLKRASSLFSKLTLGRYVELLVDVDGDKARLAGLANDQSVVPVEGMSEGTVDQLFMALRLAAVEDAVHAGASLPFLADDLFINYDDRRARAGFQVLAELAQTTQVLFFTHHQHLIAIAEAALAPLNVSKCQLAPI